MKTHHALIAAPFLLLLGAIAGREIFPKDQPVATDQSAQPSHRGKRNTIRVPRSEKSGPSTSVSPSDLRGLLDLVDPLSSFETDTRLRAALGELGPGALEDLILQMDSDNDSHPGFHTLRYSLLNHLVSKDPFHALEMILAHHDAGFRNSSIALIMQGAARLDLDAAKEALELIQDQQLLQLAKNAVLNATMASPDASSEELLALLNEKPESTQHFVNYGFSPWGSYQDWGGNFVNLQLNPTGALAKLAQKDLAAAEAYALGLKTKGERDNAMLQITASLATQNPALALEWASNLEAGPSRDQSITSVLSSMAATDPVRAASLLGEISSPQQRGSAISSIASNWAQKDPNAAIAWLASLPASQSRISAYSNVAYQIAQTDPRAAMILIEKVPGNTQSGMLANILGQWINADFPAARDWVTTQTDPIKRQNAIAYLIGPWAQKDPSAAATFLEQSVSNTPNSNLQNHFSNLANQWAAKDQNAALAWANRLENDDFRKTALGGVYQSWANSSPAEVANHLATLTGREDRQSLINTLASTWTNQDPVAAQNWLGSLPPNERYRAASSAMSSLSSNQPSLAAELYDRLVTEADNNEEHLNSFSSQASSIANQWSTFAPAEAAEWAAGISTENVQSSAYANIASNWVQYDLQGVAGWIDSLPTGQPRDQATQSLVSNIQQIDPSAAFDWADTITDDSKRYSSVQNTLNQWKATDPEAARQAAASANISEDQREQILRQLK